MNRVEFICNLSACVEQSFAWTTVQRSAAYVEDRIKVAPFFKESILGATYYVVQPPVVSSITASSSAVSSTPTVSFKRYIDESGVVIELHPDRVTVDQTTEMVRAAEVDGNVAGAASAASAAGTSDAGAAGASDAAVSWASFQAFVKHVSHILTTGNNAVLTAAKYINEPIKAQIDGFREAFDLLAIHTFEQKSLTRFMKDTVCFLRPVDAKMMYCYIINSSTAIFFDDNHLWVTSHTRGKGAGGKIAVNANLMGCDDLNDLYDPTDVVLMRCAVVGADVYYEDVLYMKRGYDIYELGDFSSRERFMRAYFIDQTGARNIRSHLIRFASNYSEQIGTSTDHEMTVVFIDVARVYRLSNRRHIEYVLPFSSRTPEIISSFKPVGGRGTDCGDDRDDDNHIIARVSDLLIERSVDAVNTWQFQLQQFIHRLIGGGNGGAGNGGAHLTILDALGIYGISAGAIADLPYELVQHVVIAKKLVNVVLHSNIKLTVLTSLTTPQPLMIQNNTHTVANMDIFLKSNYYNAALVFLRDEADLVKVQDMVRENIFLFFVNSIVLPGSKNKMKMYKINQLQNVLSKNNLEIYDFADGAAIHTLSDIVTAPGCEIYENAPMSISVVRVRRKSSYIVKVNKTRIYKLADVIDDYYRLN